MGHLAKKVVTTPIKFHYIFNIREQSNVFQSFCCVVDNFKFKFIQNTYNVLGKMKSDVFLVALRRQK